MLISFFAGSRPSLWDVSNSALTAQVEEALKPGGTFKECANCPEMVVVPVGSFMMGSPENEAGRYSNEGPQRLVTIAAPFAVAKFEITSTEWSACLAHGGCKELVGWVDPDDAFPVLLRHYLNVTSDVVPKPKTKVSWDKAKQYVAWIAKLTGKPYRLLTEAEWEYAARAGKQTRYSWGDEVGTGNVICNGCGPDKPSVYLVGLVGRFAPNEFGLYDMHGSVSEWVEDCYNDRYDGAPTDGSAWTAGGGCADRVVRGGSKGDVPERLRSASRTGNPAGFEHDYLGFRVARTLNR
jgi:formylglycine-generating enzyme required for sulfatase activity